jgi:hypothetical protein
MKSKTTTSQAAVSPAASPAIVTLKRGSSHPAIPSLRLGVVTPPVNDGGIVKLGTSSMNDTEVLNFASAENTVMTDNLNYPDPSPSVADLATQITSFSAAQEAVRLAKIALKDATNQKDAERATLESLLKARASYVQLTSNGNTALIINAGFQVRSAPTPVGNLTPPVNLYIELNGTPGVMFLDWAVVPNARSYNIQFSTADTMDRAWLPLKISSSTRQKLDGLTLGQTYAFRVAAIGGASGQSDWSAEVIRMAA